MLETQSWRDNIRSRDEYDAEDFNRRLLATHGPDVANDWQNVYVGVGQGAQWFENYGLSLIESRDV